LPQLLAAPKLVERPARIGTRPTDGERARLAALSAGPSLVIAPTPASRSRPASQVVPSGQRRVSVANPNADAPLDRLKWGASVTRDTFVPAPAYDEEHPEELSYRPFPIAPFLTATASADDPALARMRHPDLAKTLEMLDQAESIPPMRLRPGSQTAQLMWAQEFKGEAINLSSLIDLDAAPAAPAPLTNRTVHTRAQ
jgi:hypothetical protein